MKNHNPISPTWLPGQADYYLSDIHASWNLYGGRFSVVRNVNGQTYTVGDITGTMWPGIKSLKLEVQMTTSQPVPVTHFFKVR